MCKHEYEHIDSTATCLSEGIAEHYRCSKCGELFDTEKKHTDLQQLKEEKTEHNYSDLTKKVPATCETDGTKAHYYCLDCGKYFDTEKQEILKEELIIEKLNHKIGTEWKTDETSHWQECEKCKEKLNYGEHRAANTSCGHKSVCEVCKSEYGKPGEHRLSFIS